MKKIIISTSMVNTMLGDILDQEITLLCKEFNKDKEKVMAFIFKANNRDEMNNIFEDLFPGQLKIID